jgi:hypothetical protein
MQQIADDETSIHISLFALFNLLFIAFTPQSQRMELEAKLRARHPTA